MPPALAAAPTFTVGWDMVLASPRGTITGTWRGGGGAATPFTVSAGTPIVIALSGVRGTAGAYDTAETRGIFIEASSSELIVDHRESSGLWQSSSTIKASSYSLGTRFRLGGYNLNAANSTDTGFDYASIYAPFGATVTLTAPPGAALPFWSGSATADLVVVLSAEQTYVARTVPGLSCTREIDAALVTSTDPIAVDTGGRGWGAACGVIGGCGDDGADNVLPVGRVGTQYVAHDFPSLATDGEDVTVVADTAGTEVRVNGALVATLAAGGTFTTGLTGVTYIETSNPAYVYQNSGLMGCELDIALLPPVVLAPLGAWTTDFNVPTGSTGQAAIVIATTSIGTLRLDGAIPVFLSSGTVPGRPDLTAVTIVVTTGNHSIAAGSDFQLGLVTAAGGAGLFAYYTPFRVAGCGDAVRMAPEGCDDGDVNDGDGCSSTCQIEIGFTGCTVTGDCVPAGRCDTGTCVARCLDSASCNDTNPCTTDTCDGSGACVNASVTGGSMGGCAAGMVCSGPPADVCVAAVACGDGTIAGSEDCDDGDLMGGDGCSATCTREPGWRCSCATPTFTYSGETLAGRLGGDGGGPGPQMGCTGNDVLIGLALDWSNGTGTATRTRAICGAVSVSAGGVVTTTRTTSAESGGSGCAGWDPSVYSPDVLCPSGMAIVGLRGTASGATLFTSASIVCQAMGVDGRPAGPEMTFPVTGGSGTGAAQVVDCPAGTIARFFQTRAGCGQDALDLFCGVPAAVCTGTSICSTQCGDGAVGAPVEACDTAGESATCDANCTPASCGDTTINAAAGETCDTGGESATCDADCTAALCGDAETNAAAGEACDSGGESASCDLNCTLASCGDGTVNAAASETCDDSGESVTCDADCTVASCGDTQINATAGETCDDGNVASSDGCSATCGPDTGWVCSCAMPTITYGADTLAGRVGGDGGGAGPQMGCSGNDVLIGLAIDWSNSRLEGVRTRAICGSVSVSAAGVVTTARTTSEESGGSGCGGWDPSTFSPEALCPSGSAIVGIRGQPSMLSGTTTLFTDLSIACRAMSVDGTPSGPTTIVRVTGGGAAGSTQVVDCPAGTMARFFRTRSGCAQDALDLFCGVPTAECSSGSICRPICGDGVVGAPVEACDDGGESAACDADCTAATCGDGTVNTTAAETCDGAGETTTCDGDCTAATCGDGRQNTIAGESCDDGNVTGGDGCSAACVSEACGNSVIDASESCDDGGESATCDADCTAAMCGDSAVNMTAGEDCDTAGASATCDVDCTDAACGDGTLNTAAGEACDDGDTTSGDGCSAVCAIEPPPVDAGVRDAGIRDAGSADAGAGDGGAFDAGRMPGGLAGGACSCGVAAPQRVSALGCAAALALLVVGARRRRRARTTARVSMH